MELVYSGFIKAASSLHVMSDKVVTIKTKSAA